MSPEDVLRELRDIQMPPTETVAATAMLDYRPLVLIGVVILVILALRWHRANAWRRAARKRLAGIARLGDMADRRDAIVALAQALPRGVVRGALPVGAFLPRDRLTEAQLGDLWAAIDAAIRRGQA